MVSSFSIAWESAPPAVSAWRSCASCCDSAAVCWISWLLARLRSLISSATLVSSWAARVRATAACDRSWITMRNPSANPIKLITISRWLRAVRSAERLGIFHQEGRVVSRKADASAAHPAQTETVDPAAALELGELVGVPEAGRQRGRIPDRRRGIGRAQPAAVVDQDVDAGVVEGRRGHDPLAVDRDRFCAAGLQRLDPRFERSVLILELVDALTQGLFTRQAVGGRQRLAPELRGGEAGDEEGGQRNARQHGHPWRHGAV